MDIKPGFLLRAAVVSALVCLCLAGNLTVPYLLWHGGGTREMFGFYSAGVLTGEVMLLGIWSALGAHSVLVRLAGTIGLLLTVVCSYIAGLRIASAVYRSGDMPAQVGWMIVAAGVALFFSMQLPLWTMRGVYKLRIGRPADGPLSNTEERTQFGLLHLMIAMAVVAVSVVMLQTVLSTSFEDGMPMRDFLLLCIGGGSVFLVFSAVLALPSIWLILGNRLVALIVLVPAILAGPVVVVILISAIFGNIDSEGIRGTFAFAFGTASSTCLAMGIARLLGYCLLGPSSKDVYSSSNSIFELPAEAEEK